MSCAEITHTPKGTERNQVIKSLGRQTGEMGVGDEVSVVYSWKYTPTSVDLRIILVNLRDDEKQWRKEQ